MATNTSPERPLEGQSPFVVNVSGSGEWESTGTEVTLLYNVFGRRIVEVGALGSPDTYEEPFHQLDFVAKQALGAGFKLGFKARNLLNGEKSVTQGGLPRSTWRKGREFSLQLSWAIP